jgi:hypothetical protein
MDWNCIAPDYEPDGSLRDIYVLGTGLTDWQHVLDALRKWMPAPVFTYDGEPTWLPERVEEIFLRSQEQQPFLTFVVGGRALFVTSSVRNRSSSILIRWRLLD